MRIVVALGGNALLRHGEPLDVSMHRRHIDDAAGSLAAIARGNGTSSRDRVGGWRRLDSGRLVRFVGSDRVGRR